MANKTQLYLSPKFTEKKLEQMINESLATVFPKLKQKCDYRIGSTRIDKYQTRTVYFRDPEEQREMRIFIKTTIGGIKVHYLSLGADKNAQKLFRHMVEAYGGIYVKTDYNGEAEIFENSYGE